MSQPSNTNKTSCGICHKPISINHGTDTEIIMTDVYIGCPNQHLFHRECIQTWLLNSKECPLCYEPFSDQILQSFTDFKRQVKMQKEAEAELERQMKEEEIRKKRAAEQEKQQEINQALQTGTQLFEEKKYKEAINFYWDYIDSHGLKKSDREYNIILFALSLIYFNMTKYGLAVQQLSQIVQEDPSFPKAFKYLERSYEKLGMPDKARWARERISNSREFSQSDFFYGVAGAQKEVQATSKKSQSELERIISVVYSDNPFFAELNPDGKISTRAKQKAKKVTDQLFEEKEEQITVEDLVSEQEADLVQEEPQANVLDELGMMAPPTTPKSSLPPKLIPPSHLKPPPMSKQEIKSPAPQAQPKLRSEPAAEPVTQSKPQIAAQTQNTSAPGSQSQISDKPGREIENALKIECMAAKIDVNMPYRALVSKIQEMDFQLKELRNLLDELGEAFLGDDSMDLDAYMEQENRIKGQIDDFDNKLEAMRKLKSAKYD